jgi:hypothetical protein
MTIQRSHREAYDIVQSVVPEGEERARQIARFVAGATADGAGALFARQVDETRWAELAAIAGATPTFRTEGGTAEADVSGQKVSYKVGPKDGRWGYAGFTATSEELKRRAIADLGLLRRNAADYERAAIRGESR